MKMKMTMQKYVSLLALVILCCGGVNFTLGMKTTFSSNSPDVFSNVFVRSFGMTSAGSIDINYEIGPDPSNSSYIMLVGVTESQRIGWYSGAGDAGSISTVCQQPSQYRTILAPGSSGNFTWSPVNVNEYSLIAMQCKPTSDSVSISISADIYNVLSDGSTGYLSIEDVMLIRVYQGEMIAYALLLAGLFGQYYFRKYGFISVIFGMSRKFL
jgi:hypothetical protein